MNYFQFINIKDHSSDMEKLTKNLLTEITAFLTIKDYFKLKNVSKTIRYRLEQVQSQILKREAFNLFCPYLFKDENPFRSSKISSKEMKNMFYKFPEEGDSCKDFKMTLRSFLLVKKALKFQEKIYISEGLKDTADLEDINPSIFNQFIEKILFNSIRNPSVPLPQNIDEVMQETLGTCFQEYLYAQYGWQAKKEDTFSSIDSIQFVGRLSIGPTIQQQRAHNYHDLTKYINSYLSFHKDKIVKALLRLDRDSLFKRFYYIRWYHIEPSNLTQYQICDILPDQYRSSAPDVLINLLEGIYMALSEKCLFVSSILQQDIDFQTEPLSQAEFYATMWNSYISSIINLDEQLQEVNKIINDIYQELDRNDEKEDYPFSILKMGLMIWRQKVFKKNNKQLMKSVKILFRQLLKIKKNEMMMKQTSKQQIQVRKGSEGDSSDISQQEQFQDVDEFNSSHQNVVSQKECLKKNALKITLIRISQSFLDLSLSPTSVHFIGTTHLKIQDTVFDRFAKLIICEANSFHQEQLVPNPQLYQNTKELLQELQPLIPISIYRELMKTMTEMTVNTVKEKIKKEQRRFLRKQTDNDNPFQQEDEYVFKHSLGKYMKEKKISIIVQKHLSKVLSKEDINLYNNSINDYSKGKRQIAANDERIMKVKENLFIQYDKDDLPLSEECFDINDIKTDISHISKTRFRGSMKAIPLHQENNVEYVKKGRFSLIPFQQHRASLISNSNSESQRRSILYSDFSSLNRQSNVFQNCNIDYASMLDFFTGRSNMSAPNRETMVQEFNKESADAPIFQEAADSSKQEQEQQDLFISRMGTKEEMKQEKQQSKNSSGSGEKGHRSFSVPSQPKIQQKKSSKEVGQEKMLKEEEYYYRRNINKEDRETECSSSQGLSQKIINFQPIQNKSLGIDKFQSLIEESKDILEDTSKDKDRNIMYKSLRNQRIDDQTTYTISEEQEQESINENKKQLSQNDI